MSQIKNARVKDCTLPPREGILLGSGGGCVPAWEQQHAGGDGKPSSQWKVRQGLTGAHLKQIPLLPDILGKKRIKP